MKRFIGILALTLSVSAMATDYSCTGTEPFWGLKITQETMSFDNFEDTQTTEAITSKQTAAGLFEDFAFVVKTDKASATVITGACTDGMSDTVYPKHVMYSTGDSLYYGCCKEKVNVDE